MTTIEAWMSSNFVGIPPLTAELAALVRLKNRCIIFLAYNGINVVSTLAPSFLIGSS